MASESSAVLAVQALILEGLQWADGGDYVRATEVWKKAAEQDPSSRPASLCLELLKGYLAAEVWSKAVTYFLLTWKQKILSFFFIFLMGDAYFKCTLVK